MLIALSAGMAGFFILAEGQTGKTGDVRRHDKSCTTNVLSCQGCGYPVNSANQARLRYPNVSCRPGEAQCRNLIFSGTRRSLGNSGLPLWGNRNEGSGMGTGFRGRRYLAALVYCRGSGTEASHRWSGVTRGYQAYSANRVRLRYRHLSFRPSEAQCRNLIFSGTSRSLGDSGLPLWGNRNEGSGMDAGFRGRRYLAALV